MGDFRRNKLFANFIFRQWSKAKNVLVIADGDGELSQILSEKYNITAIEPKLRSNQKFKVIKKFFYKEDEFDTDFDLIVGMHPDEGTIEIISYANKHKINFAVVPCCIKSLNKKHIKGIDGNNFNEWIKRLKTFYQGHTELHYLPMQGKNIVLYNVVH